MSILNKIFGTYSEKELKRIRPIVAKVMGLEDEYSKLSDEDLQNKTVEFKDRLKNGETLNDILPEAFATVREASWRVLGLKPYEVQVIGGIILHQGRIAEMKTGEGKTLVATLPTYLNALEGKGVFVITVNEYLAKRDSEQMGKVYNFLGLTVGLIEHDMLPFERKMEYNADIVYATNNEIGFDYLKDNMAMHPSHKVQRGFNYAIVDEVDSILIDEARTPLIISGEGDDVSEGYTKADSFVKGLTGICVVDDGKMSKLEAMMSREELDAQYKDYDYTVDEKNRTVSLTERGIDKAEKFYNVENLGDMANVEINHYISRALKAHAIFKRDIDYVVKNNEIVIIDEHTGRLMDGRRYSEGIHQAIETKEGVEVKKESKTLATISFQNLFKKFSKLSGMTGTAMTEEEEFKHTYGLDVVAIPTNKAVQRIDKTDKVFTKKSGKLKAIVETVKECNEKGQPILVGTTSVESSEELSRLFSEHGIVHNVLNAKFHEQEAQIVAQAGEYRAVTIATNMAGRGTDILLGGNADYRTKQKLAELGYAHSVIEESNTHTVTDNPEIIEVREKYQEIFKEIQEEIKPKAELVRNLGGLYILGTERHSSRRIDNQLRGRAGRQGDPGTSEFLLSLEDDLMRLFGADKLSGLFSASLPEDMPIDVKMISNSIEQAQKRIEGMHFGSRKTLLDYDSVMNLQREIIYKQRDVFLDKECVSEDIFKLIETFVTENVNNNVLNKKSLTLEDQEAIQSVFAEIKGLEKIPHYTEKELEKIDADKIIKDLLDEIKVKYEFFEKHTVKSQIQAYEKRMLLFLIDSAWQDHIVAMDELKEGIGLRAYGQKDPVIAYKTEGFEMFEDMLNYVRHQTLKNLMTNYYNLVSAMMQAQMAKEAQQAELAKEAENDKATEQIEETQEMESANEVQETKESEIVDGDGDKPASA